MNRLTLGIVAMVLVASGAGCGKFRWDFGTKAPEQQALQPVPAPLDLMLPRSIRIHVFTRTETFDEERGLAGVNVRIEAVDAYGDSTKAFGTFRFEMYQFVPNTIDPKGKLLASWDEPLLDPRKNLLHWQKVHRIYEFKLQWDRPVPVGQRFVLSAIFSSPFTERMITERVFVSGQ